MSSPEQAKNPPAQAENHENAVVAMHDQKFKLPGDVVNKATAELPEEQRSLIRWLHAYACDRNLSMSDLAAKVRYDNSTLSRVFRGVYSGNYSDVCAAISRFKDLEEKRSTIRRAPFVTTSLSRRIFKILEAALTFQKVAFIYGESQIGKTTTLEEYQRMHNHGETIVVRMPAGGALGNFLKELAIALRISPEQKEWQLRQRIKRSFDDRMLLIVDQAHECFRSQYSNRSTLSLLFVMEIFDYAKCGVVIVGTRTLRHELEAGRNKDILRQLGLRSLAGLQLPDKPSATNLNEFAAHYGLPAAEGEALMLQSEIIRDQGLGKWCTVLQAASRIAAKEGKKLTWAHVIRADAGLKSLEKGLQ
jgi:DNA transposition AAA+ family ATPase